MSSWPSPAWAQAPLDLSSPVLRQEVSELDGGTRSRIIAAFRKMLERDSAGYCEYIRLATYHNDHCVHGEESFPGWHRAYLCDFEHTMRRADIANGGDGNIGECLSSIFVL